MQNEHFGYWNCQQIIWNAKAKYFILLCVCFVAEKYVDNK